MSLLLKVFIDKHVNMKNLREINNMMIEWID